MKSSNSTEMDRLLRRAARLKGEALRVEQDTVSDIPAGAPHSAHLDADEMNAYAEGALPEAARSRYFAHLADCHACRKLVTELTLAASISVEGKARVASLEAVPSNSWRRWMAAIFSPPVLRYGVPALALLAVIIVAIVAMRSQREVTSVAQNKDESRYSAPAVASDSATANTTMSGITESHANSNTASLIDQQSQTPPGVAATPVPAKPAQMEEDAPIVSQQNTAAKSTTAQNADAKDNSRETAETARQGQTDVTVAADAPPPPAPKSPVLSAPEASATAIRDKREEPKKSKVAGKDDTDEISVSRRAAAGGAIANKPQANEGRNDMGSVAATSRPSENQPRRRTSTAARSGSASDTATEKERSTETRSVGGRRFQKQGNVWVDTAYNDSRPTTNIRRGSEQYRGLAADEPGLRAIAEQLGGQVIVVWNSRAYRFY